MPSRQIRLLLAAFAVAVLARAAQNDLPKAEDIIDRHVHATGGKQALQSVRSLVMTGKVVIVAQGLQATLTTYSIKGGKNYRVMELPGVGKIEQGTDGNVVWEKSAVMGPRIREGAERELALREAKLGRDADWRADYVKVETLGLEEIDGKPVYKILATPKVGKPETRYYDKGSGLMTRMTVSVPTPMGEISSDVTISDYRAVAGGIKVPHSIVTKFATQEMRITFESVKLNEPVPEDLFKLPPEVQALVDKKAAAPAN
ncbi:MAG: hypothetical protein HYZ57_06430 [Acidobacteria bacterium]|nr:hypothetical protein [Acidobacteriota bacterium]MBI3279460.1 hypothetical protein [Acidobacteriota bacterium]